jgi:hypothetical protein
MEMICQLHAPAALLSGKEHTVPIVWEAGWVPELVWTLWSREKSLALVGNRNPAVQPVARRYPDSHITPYNL